MDKIARAMLLCFTTKHAEIIVVQISSGRMKVNHVSPHVSVRNLMHTGLNKNRMNKTKVNQYRFLFENFFVMD